MAAYAHGVPATTLKDRLSGRVKHGTKPGPPVYLSPKEETVLSHHLIEAENMGYGKTRRQVKHKAEAVARENGLLRSTRVTDGWWRRFMERQKDLTVRCANPSMWRCYSPCVNGRSESRSH